MKRLALLALVLAGCHSGGPTRVSAPPAASLAFEDVTAKAGIHFTHQTGADGRTFMPESVGPGGAFLDYDGDGLLDVFLVNSSGWPDRPAHPSPGRLFRNQGDGTFRDVTAESGLGITAFGQGCAIGDYDNDGREDLLLTCVGRNHLFHNEGGHFRDVTDASGVGDGPQWAWHTSAAWFDYNKDGLLDLFVCRYAKWSPATDVACHNGNGKRTYCGPTQYGGDVSDLYLNLGKGRFRNVSRETGVASRPGKGLGVLPIDENGDGWPDLFVSNDLVPNHLWRSEGGKRFHEVGDEAGVAVAQNGRPRAGMGVDVADVRNDGGIAFCVGNFAGEGLGLFHQGGAFYSDDAGSAGLLPASLSRLTFGLAFLDVDRDGWQDLFSYNGHVDPYILDGEGKPFYKQRPQLFRNDHGRFLDATDSAGPAFQQPQVGRGCAVGDWDNDGKPDLLLCENAGPARLLRNVSTDRRHWLGIRLIGGKGNRDGYGAVVSLTAGGATQRRWVRSGASYLSHSDTRALFGLGEAAAADSVEVRWLSGQITRIDHPAPDHYLEIREPS